MKIRIVLLFCFCIVAFPSWAMSDAYLDVAIPVYDKGMNVTDHIDKQHQMKSVKYQLVSDDLCSAVIKYYDVAMLSSGYKPYSSDGLGRGVWEIVGEGEKTNITPNDLPAKYLKSWVDQQNSIRYFLTVWGEFEEKRIKCSVECLVGNFYSITPLNLFFQSLSKGEEDHVNSLMEKYSSKNGEMDTARALSENKDDLLLLRFLEALGQIRGKKSETKAN